MKTIERRIAEYEEKLAANVAEAKRQMEFAGVRLGVFEKLRVLERQRDRWEEKVFQLKNQLLEDQVHQ